MARSTDDHTSAEPPSAEHPSAEQLHAFALGDLPPEQLDAIEQHVETCDVCCGALRCIPDDTFVGRLKLADTAIIGDPQKHKAPIPISKDIPSELQSHPRYEVTRWLGGGGMGAVYEANHRLMERVVAIKVINQAFMRNKTAIERFAVEVKAAAKLSHPNIVSAFDADQAAGLHFLVMEYVAGENLAERVAQQGRLGVTEACGYARQVARGLQHAHEQSMVHRDIKPKNLMLTDSGTVKILDFGLARFARQPDVDPVTGGDESGITVAGVAIGTPDYLSPEQIINAKQADIRSDIYSLGCTLYFMLSGQPPFPGGSNIEKLSAHLERTPQSLDELRSDLPAGLTAVLDRMMHRDPKQRFQTPDEVASALEPFTSDTLRPAITPHVPSPRSKRVAGKTAAAQMTRRGGFPKRYWPWAAGSAIALAIAAGLFFSPGNDWIGSDGTGSTQAGPWKMIGSDYGTIDIDTSRDIDTITMEPIAHTSMCGDGKGPCLYRQLTGNFMVTTHVRVASKYDSGKPAEEPMNMAGMFVSDRLVPDPFLSDDQKRYKVLLVGTSDSGNEHVRYIDSDKGHDNSTSEMGFQSGELRVARLDEEFYVLSRPDNQREWTLVDKVSFNDSPVRVGLVAGAYYEDQADLRAIFSNVRIKPINDPSEIIN